jgi:hypothetical protein
MLARCGWAAGNSSDSYTIDTVASSLPGMKVLSGWPDALSPVHAPCLYCLQLPVDQLQAFIDSLFVISIGKYKHGGRLCIVLETCTASCIMYYKEIMEEPGKGRTMSGKMVQAAIHCGLAKAMSDGVQLLRSWSSIIRANFDRRNNAELVTGKDQAEAIRMLRLENAEL